MPSLALAVESGGTLSRRPANGHVWGGYRGYFADPDGHLWEVAHNRPVSTVAAMGG